MVENIFIGIYRQKHAKTASTPTITITQKNTQSTHITSYNININTRQRHFDKWKVFELPIFIYWLDHMLLQMKYNHDNHIDASIEKQIAH